MTILSLHWAAAPADFRRPPAQATGDLPAHATPAHPPDPVPPVRQGHRPLRPEPGADGAPGSPPPGETQVELEIEDIGPVRLRIRARRGRLTLNVLANDPAALALLRRHADELTGALADSGIDGATVIWGDCLDTPPGPSVPCNMPSPAAGAMPDPVSADLPAPRHPSAADLDLLL